MLGRVGGALCLDQSERMAKKTQQFKIWRLHDLKKQAITLLSHDRLNKSATLIFWQISYTHLDTCTHLSLVYSLSVKHATKTTPLKINLAGGFNPFEKYALVKLDHFPRDRGENKNIWVATHLWPKLLILGKSTHPTFTRKSSLHPGIWNHQQVAFWTSNNTVYQRNIKISRWSTLPKTHGSPPESGWLEDWLWGSVYFQGENC